MIRRVLTVNRHGVDLRFDDRGFAETPYVYRPLASGRLYEEDFLEHIRDQGLRGAYIDVGSHLGTHAVWFAALCPATRVHAVEPVKRFTRVIRRNAKANKLGRRIKIHQVGVSDAPGKAANLLSPEHQMGFETHPEPQVETFAVVRLDALVREQVAMIKLDVEGMEAAALLGAEAILLRDRPRVYAEARTDDEHDAVTKVLANYGYQATGLVFNPTPTYEFAGRPN
jgi:FkbM family methyltransferase